MPAAPYCAEIRLGGRFRQEMIDHCRQRLGLGPDSGDTREKKAYGLLAGTIADGIATVTCCRPLLKNARFSGHFKSMMDRAMADFATPSQTPLSRRGWVADPRELLDAVKEFQARGWHLIGTYHMHRVGWEHDPLRDTPTRLDAKLAEKSGLAMVIISMVRPDEPVIRAFFEGDIDQEIPITVID